MIKTGKEHLESLRDGRVVFIGDERIEDVTTHPAFRRAAKTVAGLYDLKHQRENREILTFQEGDQTHSMWFLQARNQDDLRKRMAAHKLIADQTCGMMGRSMDHVSSFVTGMSTNPSIFDTEKHKFSENILNYY